MSRTRLMKISVKISIKAQRFINAFLMIGANNLINPIANPVTAIVKSTAAKIVNAVILFNFLIVNYIIFHFVEQYICKHAL